MPDDSDGIRPDVLIDIYGGDYKSGCSPDIPLCFFLFWRFRGGWNHAGGAVGFGRIFWNLCMVGDTYCIYSLYSETDEAISVFLYKPDIWNNFVPVRSSRIYADCFVGADERKESNEFYIIIMKGE